MAVREASGQQSESGRGSANRLAQVRAAARGHFQARGYEAASMREIAAAAGINIATLYFYCSTKEQLLFDVLYESQREILAELRESIALAGPGWADRLAAAIRLHVRVCARGDFGATISKVDIERLDDQHRAELVELRDAFEAEFRQVIAGGIAAGELREVDVKLVTYSIIGTGLTVARWYRADGPLSAESIADTYVEMYLDLLCPARQSRGSGLVEHARTS
jgi:AcrR family transcriptional regulator